MSFLLQLQTNYTMKRQMHLKQISWPPRETKKLKSKCKKKSPKRQNEVIKKKRRGRLVSANAPLGKGN